MRAVSKRFLLLFLVVPLVAFHDPADPGVKYRAEITRTEYGIPHIIARNWEGLGYGHGYAYAQDNFCVLLQEIVVANGQSDLLVQLYGERGKFQKQFAMFLQRLAREPQLPLADAVRITREVAGAPG